MSAHDAKINAATEPSEWDLVITRVFDALWPAGFFFAFFALNFRRLS